MIRADLAGIRHRITPHASADAAPPQDRFEGAGLASPLVHKLKAAYGFLFGPVGHPPEPPRLHGEAYLLRPDGQTQVIRRGHHSDPHGNDVPSEAVVNNRVVIALEGINNDAAEASVTLAQVMEKGGPNTVRLGQPMIVIHEGIEKTRGAAMSRIGHDVELMKRDQRGSHVREKAFQTDAAVQTCYDLVKQQLDRGRDVLLVPHSGGGAESGLALNLLARHGYEKAIGEHVRVMTFAGMASPEDYVRGGVKPENVLFVGDQHDAIAVTGSQFIDPHHPKAGAEELEHTLKQPGMIFTLGPVHSLPNIMNKTHDHVQAFLDGGPGGTYLA
ncbi:MAG TPA: hypothetical protein VGO93_16065 [Candidatus Xenobia bacterium]|jgi:hypothetical protein